MPYIGNSPKNNVRDRYYYTASSGQTLFSGSDLNGKTLGYQDGRYVDVYVNGIILQDTTDYTATTKTSVTLVDGATTGDLVEIVTYGIFSVADTVPASTGGSFSGNVVAPKFQTTNTKVETAVFRTNAQSLAEDTTIDADENALAIGPLTVNDGVTITITSGGNLTIL